MKYLSITEYLASIGCQPHHKSGNSLMYFSPFREEKTPSFHVDPTKNCWYDFGAGKGGGVTDLMKIIQESGVKTAHSCACCTPQPSSFHQEEETAAQSDYSVSPLKESKLISYIVNERRIDKEVALNECAEIHWTENGKERYGIAFANDADGYEVRGAIGNYKRCVGQKSVTHIKNGGGKCVVFEGFMDYLTYICFKHCASHADEQLKIYDFLILNSTAMAKSAMPLLKEYGEVFLLLDNDASGRKATKEIMDARPTFCIDASDFYSGFNDMNEWYVKQVRQQEKSVTRSHHRGV